MSRNKSDLPHARVPVNAGDGPGVARDDGANAAWFPIVAVGASAGGLHAFERLLRALPADSGMAFVMIMHLPPDYVSRMREILARATTMPVSDVSDGMAIEPNHVYAMPPECEIEVDAGAFVVSPRAPGRAVPHPIDHFMRSLAASHAERGVGIVLSGTANDGTMGLAEIKAAGGLTFVQDDSAEQPGMPRSAIEAGVVDFVLPPERIAHELLRIARDGASVLAREGSREQAFARVLQLLRDGADVDFASYKANTLQRRITRRMLLANIASIDEYASVLAREPEELQALYQDLLISVTSFFRDPQAYEALKETVFPKLTASRKPQDTVRIWVLGCSTGEEAYSLAMAYTEHAEAAGHRVPVQVFATDVNGRVIDRARSGVYARAIEQDVSPERLQRFFAPVDGRYRVSKAIRDVCVFARQNALVDPPFSRIDLIACRNMLIYMEPVLQARLIPLLHYALKPGGFLWLGGSETIGSYGELFELADSRHKIYVRKGTSRLSGVAFAPNPGESMPGAIAPRVGPILDSGVEAQREADRLLLLRYAPAGVLVNEADEILQFRGDTGPFLAPAPGRATLNLLKMLREGLMVAVRGALAQARRERQPQRIEGVRVHSEGAWRDVDLVVMPLVGPGADRGSCLVIFEEPAKRTEARARLLAAETKEAAARIPASRDESSTQEIARLMQELGATREYMQSLVEQAEAYNEELQSANEEIQSANEELQSINEELETSREEIQSANEELQTVNDELQHRNVELSQSNNDLVNLLSSVNLPIVMLGPDLRIRRVTPMAEQVLNLIATDVGRSILDVKLAVDVPDIAQVVAEVLSTVTVRERELQDRNGRWYSLRVRPYRTLDNKIDGAVMVVVDVDAIKRAEHRIGESESRFKALADTAPVGIWMSDLDGCRSVNPAFEEFVGVPEAQICMRGLAAFVHPDEREAFEAAYAAALRDRQRFESRARFRRADGAYRWMKVVGAPRFVEPAGFVGFVGCIFDITDMAEAAAALEALDRGKNEFLAILAHELRNPLSGVVNAARLLDSADPADIVRAREIIARQGAYMVRMVDDLLDISRITYGKIELRMQPLDLTQQLRRAIESSMAQYEGLGEKLETTLGDAVLPVMGDPVRLGQVFSNLLGNAAKFTPRDGRIRVTAEAERTGGLPQAVVRVRDNGVGIDADTLPRVFDLFVQGDALVDHGRTGIGLGLALTKRLVELHGGTIEAYSAGEALGSEFMVRLPLVDRSVASSKAKASVQPRVAPARVLVVDDNRDSGGSLKLLLERAGHAVSLVELGAEAVNAALVFGPELVVLDIGLPDIDGYEVARRLRANSATKDLVIVAVTGYGRDEDRARSRQAGIDEHITKPVDPDDLMARFAQRRGK